MDYLVDLGSPAPQRNVLGDLLIPCSLDPLTGFYRDGYCTTGAEDSGTHIVAAIMTREFLDYTRSQGNDLETPIAPYGFPGLKPGDRWCLCISRWIEAERAGVAPNIDLDATHERALDFVSLATFKRYAAA